MNRKNDILKLQSNLVFSKKTFKQAEQIFNAYQFYIRNILNDQTHLKALYFYGQAAAFNGFILFALLKKMPQRKLQEQLKILNGLDVPVFPFTGKDLIKRGFKPSSELGETLKKLEKIWVANGFKIDSIDAALLKARLHPTLQH